MSETTDRATIVAAIGTVLTTISTAESSLATATNNEASARATWETNVNALTTAKANLANAVGQLKAYKEHIAAMPHGKVWVAAHAAGWGAVNYFEKFAASQGGRYAAARSAYNSLLALEYAAITPAQVESSSASYLATIKSQVAGF